MVVQPNMKVLFAGANSYIAKLLIPILLDKGHEVVCQVRDKKHFLKQNDFAARTTLLTGDLLRSHSVEPIPGDIEVAFYLVGSMSQTSDFAGLEALSADNFVKLINGTGCRQLITLSDICNPQSEAGLSRRHIEEILADSRAALTVFRTSMILGPGSIATELLNGLIEKDPVVIPQKWADCRLQPISVYDVLAYLEGAMMNRETYHKAFDIGGPQTITFKDLLEAHAAMTKNISPKIKTLPTLSYKLLNYCLNYLAPVSYPAAQALLESLKYDAVCSSNAIDNIIPITRTPYEESLHKSA